MGRKSYNKKGLISQEGIKRRRHNQMQERAGIRKNIESYTAV